MAEPLLVIENLQVRLASGKSSIDAVQGLSFNIHAGEIFCLVGESGSGKSVTALSVMRLLDHAEYGRMSQIKLEEKDLLCLPEIELRKIRGKKIAIIFQEPMTSLNPVLTIQYQLAEVLKIHGQYSKKRCKDLLRDVGMGDPEHVLSLYPHQLSGGMRQRVMIAMALATEPDILIADEATTALDVTIQAQVLLLIQSLARTRNMGILLITHDLAIVSMIADQVAVMHSGKIVELASRDAFFQHPQHPYSQQLLSSLLLPLNKKSLLAKREASSLLHVNHLKVYFPIKRGIFQRTIGFVKSVDDISFTLQKGQTLGIVGESGSGKTTTAFALLRLIEEAKGEVLFQGKNILKLSAKKLRPLRRYLQMIFQDPMGSLNPRMTVRDIIAEGWDAQGLFLNAVQREKELLSLLDSVNLPQDSLDRYPHEFSGGQHQRIAIARAISMQPQIIVCDEVTSALDVIVQAQILHLLQKLQQDRKLSYVFISHNIPVVAYLAHHVAVMYLGKIVEYGTAQEIMETPKHPYTQALLAAVPVVSEIPKAFNSPKGEIPSPAHPPSGCHFHPRCPHVMPQCKITYPGETILNGMHKVRCYLYEGN